MPFSGTLGRGQFGLRMLNDKKKIEKRKKKEWRRENGEWGRHHSLFSNLLFENYSLQLIEFASLRSVSIPNKHETFQ